VIISTFLYLYVMLSALTICDSVTLKILDYGYDKEQMLSYASIREAYQQFYHSISCLDVVDNAIWSTL